MMRAAAAMTVYAATVQKVADALELDVLEVWRRLGANLNHVEPFEPPAGSSLLTPRESRLVSEMIRVLVQGRDTRYTAGEEVDDRPIPDGATTQMSDRGLKLVYGDVDLAILEMPYAADEEKPGDDPGEDHH